MIAEAQLQQEARRVLRRLCVARSALFARGDGFVVGRSSGSRVGVTAEMVQAFVQRQWIAGDGPGRYVIAPAGFALLAREQGFAAQHRQMQDTVVDTQLVKINTCESPLARLKARGLVDGTQFAAGERLRRDFTLAQLTPRMGVNWDAPVVSGSRGAGSDSISDIAMAARRRLSKALAAAGPGLADLLFDVCCHLKALEAVENDRDWARRSARVVLRIALDRLASHYGFDVVRKRAPITAWAAP
jgi:uncharacterized protein DUF6456